MGIGEIANTYYCCSPNSYAGVLDPTWKLDGEEEAAVEETVWSIDRFEAIGYITILVLCL